MKKTDKIMKKILALVKDEHKALVEEKVKKATKEFTELSEDEQEGWFRADGTIGYFFDSDHLELFKEYETGMQMILNDTEDEYDFVDLVCDYLDCCLY